MLDLDYHIQKDLERSIYILECTDSINRDTKTNLPRAFDTLGSLVLSDLFFN